MRKLVTECQIQNFQTKRIIVTRLQKPLGILLQFWEAMVFKLPRVKTAQKIKKSNAEKQSREISVSSISISRQTNIYVFAEGHSLFFEKFRGE
jgi:hypothetical protein